MGDYSTLYVKIKKTDADRFIELCRNSYGSKGTDMLRELIEAFNENRITIEPSDVQKTRNQNLYGGITS